MTEMRFAFLVAHCDPTTDPEDRGISGGTRALPAGFGLRALAEELIRETRHLHPHLGTSRLRCSLWLYQPDEPRPLTPGAMLPPPNAEHFEYGTA
ncbi:hypothetical protein ACFWG0_26510 [Streptomyces yangpuensis]|uniref:hypothetical protein n=1 Tax=Streptomyces yangpuensis TaxID=1648182 RepID=UPI0036590B7B